MSLTHDFEQRIADHYAAETPLRAPDRVLAGILASVETTPQRPTVLGRSWRFLPQMPVARTMAALGGAAAVVTVAAALALGSLGDRPAVGVPIATPDPRSSFLGTWSSTSDGDGGTQTMTVEAGQDGSVEIVVTDDVASVCSMAPSTMTGIGRLEGSTRLVIATPAYTCDDGREPRTLSGPPLQDVLRNLTYVYDPRTDVLAVGAASIWTRQGAAASSAKPSAGPNTEPTTLATMWPQTTVEEVRQAQSLADAGDPAYAWQVDPLLSSDEWWGHLRQPGAEIVARFLREELGWDEFLFNPYVGDDGDGAADGIIRGVVYLRCARGEANPKYPIAYDGDNEGAERCAPTLDDLRYEAVSLDLTQPGQSGATGIWVVSGWRTTTPFAQTDPSAAEAEATALLTGFLEARVAGDGAEGLVQSWTTGIPALDEVPLLYATTSGAPFERYEFDRVSGPRWPYGEMEFTVRLFADGGTVVEQQIAWRDVGDHRLALVHDAKATTENGQPVDVPYAFIDGQVTMSAADPWKVNWISGSTLTRGDDDEVSITLVGDPLPVMTGCQHGAAAEDANALAESIQAYPDLVTTAPVAVTIGGAEGVAMDVTPAPGVDVCDQYTEPRVFTPDDQTWRSVGLEAGSRMRLYLLDAPEGSSIRVLAIAVVARSARFDEMVAAATPVVGSIEFHAP